MLRKGSTMPDAPEYSVVIPAYNEEDRLEAPLLDTVRHLSRRATSFEVIVVDDGSRDGTARLVRDLQVRHPEVRLIRLPANRGKGFAVRTGVVNSAGEHVLFADADGSTPIQEVARLRERIDDGADVAIGSRAAEGSDVRVDARLHRKVIGRVFHAAVQVLTVGDFRDTQCGFKLLQGDVARDLFGRLRMDGFSFDVELLSMALWRGYDVVEVPVNWRHVPGSRVNLVTDSFRMLRDLFVIRSRLVRGEYGKRRASARSLTARRGEQPAGVGGGS